MQCSEIAASISISLDENTLLAKCLIAYHPIWLRVSWSAVRESLSLLYMWAQGLDLRNMERSIDENLEMYGHVTRLLLSIQQILHSGMWSNIACLQNLHIQQSTVRP